MASLIKVGEDSIFLGRESFIGLALQVNYGNSSLFKIVPVPYRLFYTKSYFNPKLRNVGTVMSCIRSLQYHTGIVVIEVYLYINGPDQKKTRARERRKRR